MKYARHAPSSYKVHLAYGRLTLADVKRACDATSGSAPPGQAGKISKWARTSMSSLLSIQREVTAEIQRRQTIRAS